MLWGLLLEKLKLVKFRGVGGNRYFFSGGGGGRIFKQELSSLVKGL
jgi:hypothetical protein